MPPMYTPWYTRHASLPTVVNPGIHPYPPLLTRVYTPWYTPGYASLCYTPGYASLCVYASLRCITVVYMPPCGV